MSATNPFGDATRGTRIVEPQALTAPIGRGVVWRKEEVDPSLTEVLGCRSGHCLQRIEKAKRDVLDIDWKPISLFPEEAKRFR